MLKNEVPGREPTDLFPEEIDDWTPVDGDWLRDRTEELAQQPYSRQLVEWIAQRHDLATVFAAERLSFIDELRLEAERETGATWTDPDSLEWRSLRAEVAAVLQLHERSAQVTLDMARLLVHTFPSTLNALHSAEFSERHARILVEVAVGLPDELCAEYESALLPHARLLVPSRFERKARVVRELLTGADLTERHRRALQERRTGIEAAPDGMAWYGALLSAEDAVGSAAAVTGLARGLKVEGEMRTLAQIEADVFRDLLLDPAGMTAPSEAGAQPAPTRAARSGVRPEVLIQVPVLTAMGGSNVPGMLDGYGPIDPETARQLAGCAKGFLRILIHPETGATLSFGRTVYKVPAELRRYLQLRDEVCRFVGCTRSAKYCDIDHTVPWAEHGETVAANLAHLCRGHHRLKGSSRWQAVQSPGGDGALSWTSPTGRTYTSPPAVNLPPPKRTWRQARNLFTQTEWLRDEPRDSASSTGPPGQPPPGSPAAGKSSPGAPPPF